MGKSLLLLLPKAIPEMREGLTDKKQTSGTERLVKNGAACKSGRVICMYIREMPAPHNPAE